MADETWSEGFFERDEASPREGWVVGRYELGKMLGRGGFGTVYEARDHLGERDVAVKLIALRGTLDLASLRRESSMLRAARLPGVVSLLDDGVDGGSAFLVMPRIDGSRFPGVLPRPCAWSELHGVATALLETLGWLHAAGVVHGDLKPANVLVDVHGAVHVLDFGLATSRYEAIVQGGFQGTVAYAAPEQRQGRPRTPACDLWSVGAMLFECLLGRAAMAGYSTADLLYRAQRCHAPRLNDVAPSVPAPVASVVDAMLELDPERRPESAHDVLTLLGRAPMVASIAALAELPLRATVAQLHPLFRGPEAFVHLRSDGAAVLWRRTGGFRAAVVAEVEVWLRSGIARVEHGALHVDRASLALLASGVALRAWVPADEADLDEGLRGALARLRGGMPASHEGVARLVGRGLAWQDDRGVHAAPLVGAPSVDTSTEPCRPADLLRPSARELSATAFAMSTLVVAERLLDDERNEEVGPLVMHALSRGRAHVDEQRRLMSVLTAAALALESPSAADRALRHVGAMPAAVEGVYELELLLRAALGVYGGEFERAREALDAAGAFEDARLDAWRVALVLRCAAAGPDPAAFETELARWRPWSERSSYLRARWLGWSAKAAYRRGDYARAAELHEEAASAKRGQARLASLTNAVASLLEGGEFTRSEQLARALCEEAAGLRFPKREIEGYVLSRVAAYRAGHASPPDREARMVAVSVHPGPGALLTLVDAATHWRSGDPGGAVRACRGGPPRSVRGPVPLLLEALRIAAGGTVDRQGCLDTRTRLESLGLPFVHAQGLALLASAGWRRDGDEEVVGRLVDLAQTSERARRREVLSLAECLALVKA